MENQIKYYKLKQSEPNRARILTITCCSKTNADWERSEARAKEIRQLGPLD